MSDMELIEEPITSMLGDVVSSMSVAPGVMMFPDETTKAYEESSGMKAPAESIDILTLEVKTMSGEPVRLFLLPSDATKVVLAGFEWLETLHGLGKCGVDHG